ncbi:unnamed protein product [Discula destructiva]
MCSGLTAIWRARPLRLGRSTCYEPLFARPRPIQFSPAARPRSLAAARYLRPVEKPRYDDSDHVTKAASSSRPRKPDDEGFVSEGMDKQDPRPPKPKYEPDRETATEIWMLEQALERSNFASSVLVPRLKVFGTCRQKHRMMRTHHEAISRQVYHERNRKNNGGEPADWRQLLALMTRHTPEESLDFIEDGIKIDIAAEALTRIMNDAGDLTVSAIRRRTGAIIKIFRDRSMVMLSGTRRAINEATEEFKSIAGKITVTRHYRPLDPGEAGTEELDMERDFFMPPLSRDEGARVKKRRLKQHVHTIPMPQEWTPETLRDYVISLMDTYTDAYMHAPLYPQTRGALFMDHERAVTRRLMRLFRRLPSGAGVSCSVVKLALSHMTTKGDKYGPQIRNLFVFLDRRGIPMDTDVFNILLRGPVKMRNLRKFKQTIIKMAQGGFAPNLDTWLLFLRMFEAVEIKSYILQAMNAKNMLGTPGTIQRIAEELAGYDAEHAAMQGKSLDIFLQEQEVRYGSNWLTRDAGNKVLHVLGQYGRYEDAFKLLDLMAERHRSIPQYLTQERSAMRPDSNTFITIINHAWIKNKVPLAVNIVRKMKTHKFAQHPTSAILDILFKLAWKNRLRTTIAVIWRYASLARLTTYGMRRLVDRLLRGKVGREEDPELTAEVYRALGGETLARELVGGREVLEQMLALCRRSWGDDFPRGKLGSIATKLLPAAFEERGPAIPLGTVLCQSVLLDFKCLGARKSDELRDLLESAKIKSLPLWMRHHEKEDRWTDLGPLETTEPSAIRHDDVWQEEWETEGWEATPPLAIWRPSQGTYPWAAAKKSDGSPTGKEQQAGAEQAAFDQLSAIQVNEGDAVEVKTCEVAHEQSPKPITDMRMVMINPKVWDDDIHDVPALGTDFRTPLQRQNEEAYLAALEKLSKSRVSFRYIFADKDGGLDTPEDKRPVDDTAVRDDDEQNLGFSAKPLVQDSLMSHQELLAELNGT